MNLILINFLVASFFVAVTNLMGIHPSYREDKFPSVWAWIKSLPIRSKIFMILYSILCLVGYIVMVSIMLIILYQTSKNLF